jgi:hypothetical protein
MSDDTLSLSFTGEASESFANHLLNMSGWYVQLTPLDGEPFDALICRRPIGGEDLNDYRQVFFMRADEDTGEAMEGARIETILVKDVLVY